MNRAIITATVVGTLAAAMSSGLASPAPVDHGRMAATQLEVALPGADKLALDVRGMLGSNGPLLLINADRCDSDSCQSTPYASILAASALTIDSSGATAALKTALDGVPLTIVWRPADQSGVVVGAGYFESDGNDATGSQYAGSPADVSVRYGDKTCVGSGGVGEGLVTDTGAVSGDATTEPVSALRLPAGATLHCTS